jgi:demethylmenaquinone methyltransferase/2-methoxy-6-polyprenyl-1,4-benzoquinol methylase
MSTEKVSFGFRQVSPEEKKKLVHDQFNPIASTYELADAVLSAGLDARWRKTGMRLLGLKRGDTVLDLCGGTGDFARLAGRVLKGEARVIVYDFNLAMMEAGRRRLRCSPDGGIISWIQGDAESMGFAENTFDAVMLGFGLRNFVRVEAGLGEIHRVLKPAGKILILEFSLPRLRWQKSLYHFYSFRIMPLIARLICGTSGPFRYLAESIRVFPPPERVAGMIGRAGFAGVTFRRLTAGLATLYNGRKI